MKKTKGIWIGVAAGVLLLAVVFYLYRQGKRSQSREWSAYAETVLKQDPTLAYLLAEKAYESDPGLQAARMLFEAYDRGPFYRMIPGGNLCIAGDGKHFVTRTARNEITLWDENFEAVEVIEFEPAEFGAQILELSPNGEYFALVEADQISFHDFMGNSFGAMGLPPASEGGQRFEMNFAYNGMRFLLSDLKTHTVRLYDLSDESEQKVGIDGFYLTRFSSLSPSGKFVKIELQPDKIANGRSGNSLRILNSDLETVFTTTINRGDAFSFVTDDRVVFSNRLAESSSPYSNRLVMIHLPDLESEAIEAGKGRYNFRNFTDFSRAVFQVGSKYYLFHNSKGSYAPLGEVPQNWFFREGLSEQKILIFESVDGQESATSDYNGRLINRMQGKLSFVDQTSGNLLLQQKFVTRLFTSRGELIRKIDAPFYEAGLLGGQYLAGETRSNDEERWMNQVKLASFNYERDLRLQPLFRNDFHPIQLDVARNGELILATDDRNMLRILNNKGELIQEIKAGKGPFFFARFLDDGQRILTITPQKLMTLWDASGQILLQESINSLDRSLNSAVTYSDEALFFVSSNVPREIQQYDFTGRKTASLEGAKQDLKLIDRVGETLFATDGSGNLYRGSGGELEEEETKGPVEYLAGGKDRLACLEKTGEGKTMVVLSESGSEDYSFEVSGKSNYTQFPDEDLIYVAEVDFIQADYFVEDRKEQLHVRYPSFGQGYHPDGEPYKAEVEDLVNLEKHKNGYLVSYLQDGSFYAGIVSPEKKLWYRKSTRNARCLPGTCRLLCLDDDQLLFFPTTPEEIIRLVRDEKIFGDIRSFTPEEEEKYGL
ncbi:WD40 repeat domain-containing protein [bacterium SCSIO 12741]|nr:WD40 repeat domain-containing protein [bacterium SCSIO 12741]